MKILSSLKTTLALAAALAILSAWGSFAIQHTPQAYEAIEQGVLADWLRDAGLSRPAASWWICAMIFVAALLALNTCVCVTRRLLRSRRLRRLTVRSASAHVAHLGFLLVLLAHGIGSVAGFRSDGHRVFAGQSFAVTQRPGWTFRVGPVSLDLAPEGYPRSLDAEVSLQTGGETRDPTRVSVNHPLLADGVAVYLSGAEPTLRGWHLGLSDGRWTLAEIGQPLRLVGGELLLVDWARTPDGRIALQARWTPAVGASVDGWLWPTPGQSLSLPGGIALLWGEIEVEPLATFDVRYDPGASLALAGGAALSASLVPLLWPTRRARPRLPRETAPGLSSDAF
ncbi:MAG: cytochrome c biogenesis protein ResB [Deltaproteobacteria bacterium]|nr:cytochrome c biogenesis protein ResB [Deltaproteobacteria bacterium]